MAARDSLSNIPGCYDPGNLLLLSKHREMIDALIDHYSGCFKYRSRLCESGYSALHYISDEEAVEEIPDNVIELTGFEQEGIMPVFRSNFAVLHIYLIFCE